MFSTQWFYKVPINAGDIGQHFFGGKLFEMRVTPTQ